MPNLLLVEDDVADQLLARRAFGSALADGRVHVAGDGERAIALLENGNGERRIWPDLILLDLNLPRVSGFQVIEHVRRDPRLKLIPIVILSTSNSPEDIRRCYELGANSFITKPARMAGWLEIADNIARYWLGTVQLP